jgi:hypothetical protein
MIDARGATSKRSNDPEQGIIDCRAAFIEHWHLTSDLQYLIFR